MQDKTLDQSERDLLAIIREMSAKSGPVDRAALNIEARGRGIEVGRNLSRLRELGIVEETEVRPGFLRRLFGARRQDLLTLAEAETKDPETGEAEDAPEAGASAAQSETPETETAATTPAETAAAETEPPAPEEPAPEPKTPEEAKQAELSERISAAVAAAIAARKTDAPEEAPAPKAEPAKTEAPRPAPAPLPRPERFAADDYTIALGGGPASAAAPAEVDPEVLDGLREMLSGMGMELTMAGEALISARITAGFSEGDALSQVVLFAFAHALHYDLLNGNEIDARGLHDYAEGVVKELAKLRDAGAVTAERFGEDTSRLLALIDNAETRQAEIDALLRDPVGGAAPTALLPEAEGEEILSDDDL